MKLLYCSDQNSGYDALSRAVAEALETGRVYVVIPDQIAVAVEDALSRSLPAAAQLDYDVVSFRRFADYVFRALGGIRYKYADRAVETVTMWRALSILKGTLLHYDSATPESAPMLLSAVEELKSSMVTPEALMKAALSLPSDNEKYIDIANIYEVYGELLSEHYDDRLDVLSAAASMLQRSDFLSNSHVVMFSFAGFTAQQRAVIREFSRSALSLTVIFTIPGSAADIGKRHDFDGIERTRLRLHEIAESTGRPFSIEALPDRERGEIRLLTDSLWSVKKVASDGRVRDFELIEAPTRRGEAEAVAVKIARAVRDGVRYREIAVCTGSVESYRGIIDDVFDAYGIPYHMSYRVRIEKLRATSALFGALRVVSGGWRRDDIIAYIKTGLSGIGEDEADELEIYMTTWNIGGRSFYDPDGGGWAMNPDGYTVDWTESGERTLSSVNESRRAVCERLAALADAFSDTTTADAKSAAAVEFLRTALVEEQKDGAPFDRDFADRAVSLVEAAALAIGGSADLGGAPMSAQEYVSCLRLILDGLSVGSIPARTDEVAIADTVGMRAGRDGLRLLFMLGCADGELPAYGGDGFFSEAERITLEGVGVNVGESREYKSAMELYNFSRCIGLGRKVVFTYRTPRGTRPPEVIERITNLFPNVTREKFDGAAEADDIYSVRGALSALTRAETPELREAARLVLSEPEFSSPSVIRTMDGIGYPISAGEESVSEDVASSLFGGDIRFSQSRLESFVSCKFGFYCSYVLGLREHKRARLDYAEIGTFIHEVLEKIFSSGLIGGGATDEQLEAAADGVIADYIARACPRGEADGRGRELFRRLRRSVLVFLRTFRDEFRVSRFRPVMFEAPFGIGRDSMMPKKIDVGGGRSAYLCGIADRVDAYRDGEGRVYVRVVDYKTGYRTFSPDDIDTGHNLQLPLYLYAIASDPENVRRLGGADGDVLVPAGFLYIGVRPSDTDAGLIPPDGVEEARRLERRGILLADESVLRAMEPALEGEYIPVRYKPDGTPYASSAKCLCDGGGISELFMKLEDTVRGIARELSSGRADADALPEDCARCRSRAVCRSAGRRGG